MDDRQGKANGDSPRYSRASFARSCRTQLAAALADENPAQMGSSTNTIWPVITVRFDVRALFEETVFGGLGPSGADGCFAFGSTSPAAAAPPGPGENPGPDDDIAQRVAQAKQLAHPETAAMPPGPLSNVGGE